MAFGVLLRQQWISGYIEFVPDWNKLPVGVSVSVDAVKTFNLNWNAAAVSDVAIDATKALDSYENASAVSAVAIDATKMFESYRNVSTTANVTIDAAKTAGSTGNRAMLSSVAIDVAKALDSYENASAASAVAIDTTKAFDSYENASAMSNVAIDATKELDSYGNASAMFNVAVNAAKTINSDGSRFVLSNIALARTLISDPGSGTADAYGFTDLLKALTMSNNVQAVMTLLATLSKTMVTGQHVTARIASRTNLQRTSVITPSLVPPPPLFKNLSIVSAECSDLLEIEPSDELVERGEFEQTTMETDSGLTYVVTSRPTPKYYVTLQWKGLKQNDADKIISIYLTTTKAFGRARSFKWKHPIDDRVYVVRFTDDLNTDRRAEITNRESIGPIQLEILGLSAN